MPIKKSAWFRHGRIAALAGLWRVVRAGGTAVLSNCSHWLLDHAAVSPVSNFDGKNRILAVFCQKCSKNG
jgi:hypothetical protein